MSEWWTYTLSDLLMFSSRSYWRLIELYNRELWPGQLVAVIAGLAIVACVARPGVRAQRIALLVLGAGWGWVAWAYHWQRYAEINMAAPYFAAGFACQALLLCIAALRAPSVPAGRLRQRVGLAIAIAGVLAYPLLAPATGHGWSRAEVAGIAPDPTVVATLGVLLAARAHWIPWLLPLAWCAIGGATLMELKEGHAALMPAVALCAVLAGLASRPPSSKRLSEDPRQSG